MGGNIVHIVVKTYSRRWFAVIQLVNARHKGAVELVAGEKNRHAHDEDYRKHFVKHLQKIN